MKNPIKGALRIAKMRRLGKGPKIADIKGIENSSLMKLRKSVPYMTRQNFALGGQPTENVNAAQIQPQNNPQPQVPATPSSFVSNVYNQYGGRAPNQDELNFWQSELSKGSTPQQVYQGISRDTGTLSGYANQYNAADPNSFKNMLTNTYQSYLGGGPNESDIAFWQNELNKGSTAQQIVSGIANDQAARNFSNEQISNWTPGISRSPQVGPYVVPPEVRSTPNQNLPEQTNSIQGLYQTYLGRDPNQDEVNYWSGQIGKGSTIGQVEDAISNDPGVIVRGIYQGYMGRDPNQDETNYWKGQLAKGSTAEQVESSIANDPGVVVGGLYQNYLGRGPNQDEMDYWKGQFAQGATADQIEAAISYDPGVMVRSAYQHYAGRDPTSEETMSGMNLLGPNRDMASFINKTFPGQDPNAGVQVASNDLSKLGSSLWNRVKSLPEETKQGAQKLLTFIAGGEGGYNSVNKGSNKPYTHNAADWLGQDLTKFTIKQIMDLQKAGKIFATGMFQIIPKTLKELVTNYNIDPNLPYDEKTQNDLGTLLALRRPNLGAYITGKSDNISKALLDLAKEWASFPDPKTGRSYHGGGNRAQHSVQDTLRVLRAAHGSVSLMPEGGSSVAFSGPSGEIPQASTPAGGGGGGSNSDATATQNFLNQYLYDNMNFQPGTSVINPGGGSSDAGVPKGSSGSGGSSAGTPGSHAGTHGASAMPTVHHPVSHGSGNVSFAPPASSGGGSGSFVTNFNPHQVHYNPNTGMYHDSSTDISYDPNRAGSKKGGSVTHDSIRNRGMDALQAYASGGKVWDKKRPKSLGKPEKLDKDQKRSAKAAAKAAGRPYPNLIDNMRAARKADGGEIKAAIKLARKRLTKEA